MVPIWARGLHLVPTASTGAIVLTPPGGIFRLWRVTVARDGPPTNTDLPPRGRLGPWCTGPIAGNDTTAGTPGGHRLLTQGEPAATTATMMAAMVAQRRREPAQCPTPLHPTPSCTRRHTFARALPIVVTPTWRRYTRRLHTAPEATPLAAQQDHLPGSLHSTTQECVETAELPAGCSACQCALTGWQTSWPLQPLHVAPSGCAQSAAHYYQHQHQHQH